MKIDKHRYESFFTGVTIVFFWIGIIVAIGAFVTFAITLFVGDNSMAFDDLPLIGVCCLATVAGLCILLSWTLNFSILTNRISSIDISLRKLISREEGESSEEDKK